MITGDNLLTAVAVGHKLEFGPKEYLTLETIDGVKF
jgi:magnesium-transporting ATPase (P-type)